MTKIILLFVGVLRATFTNLQEPPARHVTPNSAPFLVKPGRTLSAGRVESATRNGIVSSGLFLAIVTDYSDRPPVSKQLENLASKLVFKIDEAVMAQALHIFSREFVMRAVFSRVRHYSNILKTPSEHPDEVECVLDGDEPYEQLFIRFKMKWEDPDSPALTLTFSGLLCDRVHISPERLREAIEHMSGRTYPLWRVAQICRRLADDPEAVTTTILMPKDFEEENLADRNKFIFWNEFGDFVSETEDASTQMTVQIVKDISGAKRINYRDQKNQIISFRLSTREEQPAEAWDITVTRRRGQNFKVTEDLLVKTILDLTGILLPPPKVTRILQELASKAPERSTLIRIQPDEDMRIWNQLMGKAEAISGLN